MSGLLTRRRFLGTGALATVGVAGGGAVYVGATNSVESTRTTILLPGAGPTFTMALVTDVHAPQPRLDFDDVVAQVNRAQPDLVLIVGDAINRRGDEPLVEMYGPMEARHGKFAVAGNWENWGLVRRSRLAAHYARAGVAWFENSVTELTELGVDLVGLDESMNGWPEWQLMSDLPPDGRATLLLHHSPGSFDRLGDITSRPTLMLSGHTHGGQIAPFGVPLVLPPGCAGYVQGAYRKGQFQMYVSRGVGNSHLPFRVGAQPELAIIEVQRESV